MPDGGDKYCQSKSSRKGVKEWCVCVCVSRVFRGDHTDKVTCEQRPQGGKGGLLGEEHSGLRGGGATPSGEGILGMFKNRKGTRVAATE